MHGSRRVAGVSWAVVVLLLLSCGPGGQTATPADVPTAMPTAAEPPPTPSAAAAPPRSTAARPTQAAQATVPAAATDPPRPSPSPTVLPTVTPSPHASQPITPATAGQVVLLDRLGTGALQDIAWLPDGRTAVAAYVSGMGLYDGLTLEEQQFIPAYGSKAGLIASPDGRHVALISGGGVQLWDTSSGQLVRTLEAPTGGARMIALGAGGKTLAVSGPEAEGGSSSEAVTVWDIAGVLDGSAPAARLLYRLEGYANGPSGLTFSPDGRVLVTTRWYDRSRTGVGAYLEQWDASTGQPLPPEGDLGTAPDGLQHLVYSPDGRLLAGSAHSTLFIWDAATGELLKSLENESFPNAVAFSGDGRLLAAGSSDKAARVWDVAAGELRAKISDHTDWVTEVAFSTPDPSGAALLATATARDGIQLWDFATGERRAARQPVGHSDSVEAVAYSPDGEMLATAGPDQTVWLWDAGSGRALRMLDANGMSTSEWCACIWSLAFSPDGRTVATGSTDARVRLWNVQTGELLETSPAMGDLIHGLDYSPDGQRLAAGDTDGLLWVWDTAAPLEAGPALALDAGGVIVSLSFQAALPGAEGHVLATGSGFGAIRVWDADTGGLVREMQGSHNSARVVYSPDGSLLAAGESGWADEFPVRLWDPGAGQVQRVLTGHTKDVSGLAFSADGRVLASGDWDGFTRLWDVATGQPLGVLEQAASVKCAAFRPDGRQLATAGFDGLVWIWGVP